MSYLRYLCLFGWSLPTVICKRVHVLFTLFVFVWLKGIIIDLVFITIVIYFRCSNRQQCAAVILNRTRESYDSYNTHVRSKICREIDHDTVYRDNEKGHHT